MERGAAALRAAGEEAARALVHCMVSAEDESVAAAAREVLVEMGTVAVPYLVQELPSECPGGEVDTAHLDSALVSIGLPSVHALLPAIRDGNWVQSGSAWTIVQIIGLRMTELDLVQTSGSESLAAHVALYIGGRLSWADMRGGLGRARRADDQAIRDLAADWWAVLTSPRRFKTLDELEPALGAPPWRRGEERQGR